MAKMKKGMMAGIGRHSNHAPKGGKSVQHPSHAMHNKSHGLPADVFAHGDAPYGGGNPNGGGQVGAMQSTPMGNGPVEGPISGGDGDMAENGEYC